MDVKSNTLYTNEQIIPLKQLRAYVLNGVNAKAKVAGAVLK